MGTRGSALALAQSAMLARLLEKATPGLTVETVIIKTSGDIFSAQSPAQARVLADGTKGLFVKEIEEALLRREVDFAVHSGKDLPGALADGLVIAAYPEREDPRDAYIGRGGSSWADAAPGHKIATSSLRRKIQILRAKPGVDIVPMRGNVDTRLRKLEEGVCDGLVIALAGLRRLGRADVPHEPIGDDLVLPAPAQGALAVEACADRPEILERLRVLDNARTRLEVEFERSFLRTIGGGCSTPLGALARAQGSGVNLTVFWSKEDGGGAVRLSQTCGDIGRRDAFTRALAEQIKRR